MTKKKLVILMVGVVVILGVFLPLSYNVGSSVGYEAGYERGLLDGEHPEIRGLEIGTEYYFNARGTPNG